MIIWKTEPPTLPGGYVVTVHDGLKPVLRTAWWNGKEWTHRGEKTRVTAWLKGLEPYTEAR